MSEDIQTLGSLLRAARHAAGLDIETIATRFLANANGLWGVSAWAYWLGRVESDSADLSPADLSAIERAWPMNAAVRAALDDRYAIWRQMPPEINAIAADRANWPWMRAEAAVRALSPTQRAAMLVNDPGEGE